MGALPKSTYMTPEEYLQWEHSRDDNEKYEVLLSNDRICGKSEAFCVAGNWQVTSFHVRSLLMDVVDFYCAELCLVIEIDGGSHQGKAGYDAERSRILNAYGLHIIRYVNEGVLNNLPAVRKDLLQQSSNLSK